MSKQSVNKNNHINHNNQKGLTITQKHSLLPSSDEMEKLKNIDSRLVDTYINFVNNDHQHKIDLSKENIALANKQVENQKLGMAQKRPILVYTCVSNPTYY